MFYFQRDHSRVKPMMILMGITTGLSLLSILSFTIKEIIEGILCGCFYGYLFIVLRSLYKMFKYEFEHGCEVQYQASSVKV